jgi:LysR family cys regulon transcriptional activator
MRLAQLRFLCAIVDHGHNISKAATALGVSQPGITRQIKLLERELNVDVLLRRDGRIVGLTEPGTSILGIARRMAEDANNVRRISEEFTQEQSGRLAVATTHIHARYVLLHMVEQFRRAYPHVQLILRQGNPSRVFQLVSSGEADLAIASQPPEGTMGLAVLPTYVLDRSVITPAHHPLLAHRKPTLEDIARYPIITFDAAFAGASAVMRPFRERQIPLNVVMTATDADVIKAYVELGLGIAVLPTIAFDAKRDRNLRAIAASHLFESTQTVIGIHPYMYLRQYMYDFIQTVAPRWNRKAVVAVLKRTQSPPE